MQKYKNHRSRTAKALLAVVITLSFAAFGVIQSLSGASQKVFADTTAPAPALKLANPEPGAGKYTCGSGADTVQVSINFGCKGQGTAVTDATFAVIRVLSAGVGLVVIGSIVLAGIQYTTSRGDPSATAKAMGRIRNSLYALLIYIFAAAMLNFVIPKGFFK